MWVTLNSLMSFNLRIFRELQILLKISNVKVIFEKGHGNPVEASYTEGYQSVTSCTVICYKSYVQLNVLKIKKILKSTNSN